MRKRLMALLMAITLLDYNNQIVAYAKTAESVVLIKETTEEVIATETVENTESETDTDLKVNEEINETVSDTTESDTENITETISEIETENTEETTETATENETELYFSEEETAKETIETTNETDIQIVSDEPVEPVEAEPETNVYTPDEVIYDAIMEDAVLTTRCYDQFNDFAKYIYDEIIETS